MAAPIIAKLAVPALAFALIWLSGGKKKKAIGYDSGFAKGKADAMAGVPEDLNPAGSAEAKASGDPVGWGSGYADGYASVKKKGTLAPPTSKTVGDIIDKKPSDVSIADIELAAERGRIEGYNRGKDDALASRPSNPYALPTNKPTHPTLLEAYRIAYQSNYGDGYLDGQKIAATAVIGGRGGRPHTPHHRPTLPSYWYNM